MNSRSALLSLLLCWTILAVTMAKVRDICSQKATINGVCGLSTLNIVYDPESQRCKYMGCGPEKLFATLQDCEKICNNQRHRRRRMRSDRPI